MQRFFVLVCLLLIVLLPIDAALVSRSHVGSTSSASSSSSSSHASSSLASGSSSSISITGGSLSLSDSSSLTLSSSTPITINGGNFQINDNSIITITIKDAKGTPILGSEGVRVSALRHGITSPRDSASGLPTGKRQHKPFVFTKELDKSTPILYKAFVQGTSFSSVTFSKFAPIDSSQKFNGALTNIFNTTLTNVEIISIDTDGAIEEITFVYEKIQWTWVSGGVEASDNWEARK